MLMSFSSKKHTENQWFYIQWFIWLSNTIKSGATWLFPETIVYSADEAGEMMRRILAQKNWFDSFSTAWVEKPFLVKSLVVSGICLSFGLIGWAVGAATILPLTAFFVCAATHCLLVAHYHQRIMNARIIVAEIIALTAELNISKQFIDEVTKNVNLAACELKKQSHTIFQQSQVLEEQAQLIKKHKADLDVLIQEIQESTQILLAEQKQAFEELKQVAVHLTDLDNIITDTTLRVAGIGDATSQLTQSVGGIQKSQKLYSDAASRFSLFVAEQTVPKVFETGMSLEDIHALSVELDENELLIEQMKQVMASNQARMQ